MSERNRLTPHVLAHRHNIVTCIDCGSTWSCSPSNDFWHCAKCFDGACNGRCKTCHTDHMNARHSANVNTGMF